MARLLDADRARQLVSLVTELGKEASFRRIMLEAMKRGTLKRHETLRRYLDLLVAGEVLRLRLHDVGSVNPQQLYSVISEWPKVTVGLAVLRRYGLNWTVPDSDTRKVFTDFEGLVRSLTNRTTIASLEDALVRETYRDATKHTGAIALVVAMLTTRKLDVPYMLRRADEARVGAALRLLLRRVLAVVSAKETEVNAAVFFQVRAHFLKIARQYAQLGVWRLIESCGSGRIGLDIVNGLRDYDIVVSAGKQLGVTG